MPLIQRYRNLNEIQPPIGFEIYLYKRENPEDPYIPWGVCKVYHVVKYEGICTSMLLKGVDESFNPIERIEINEHAFYQYQWIPVTKLNLVQKILGPRYFELPLLLFLIWWLWNTFLHDN